MCELIINMIVSTELERELVLKLVKDFTKEYNSSNIAKEVGKTRVGTFKALKALEQKQLVTSKVLGKARFYKFNLASPFARKSVELLLMDEANKHQRWIEEFKEIFETVNVAILFGSIINRRNANDIDLMLVYPIDSNDRVNSYVAAKNEMMTKKIHLLKQTKEDLMKNLKNKDAVIIDVIRNGIVLHGCEELVELMRCVTGQEQG
ncbi:hypothetical protein JW711_05450 [Candidatus Woesearchaeota archaeon]|nr:hypothetical protein [Candidatus Woesearchaeota archaeon]